MNTTEDCFITDTQCAFSDDEITRMKTELGIRVVRHQREPVAKTTILDQMNGISDRITAINAMETTPAETSRTPQSFESLASLDKGTGYYCPRAASVMQIIFLGEADAAVKIRSIVACPERDGSLFIRHAINSKTRALFGPEHERLRHAVIQLACGDRKPLEAIVTTEQAAS